MTTNNTTIINEDSIENNEAVILNTEGEDIAAAEVQLQEAEEMVSTMRNLVKEAKSKQKKPNTTNEVITKSKEKLMTKIKQFTSLGIEIVKDSGKPIKDTGKKAIGSTAIGVGKSEQFIGKALIKTGEALVKNGVKVENWGRNMKVTDMPSDIQEIAAEVSKA